MSADNGIYILKTKDKQIRVIHTKAIENIFDLYGRYIPKQVKKYFDDVPYTKDMNVANNIAQKMFKDIDKQGICKYIESIIEDVDLPIQQRVKSWIENTGSCNLIDETQPRKNAIVIDINTKYKTPKIKLYNLID